MGEAIPMGYEETLRLIDSSINHSSEATNQTNKQTDKQTTDLHSASNVSAASKFSP